MTTQTTYAWATDAASGRVTADSAEQALAILIKQGEWAEVGSSREARDIADGAWLMIGQDAPGERMIERGGDAVSDADDVIDAEEDHLDTIRRMAYDDIAREIQQHGIRLTWAQDEECGEEATDWLRQRLGLTATTDSDGVTYRRES